MLGRLFLLAILSVDLYAKCTSGNFQECKTCKDLERATAHEDPNTGDFLHGAEWNGLFTAYVHNCVTVGENLLKRGADPSVGGSFGSMILSVVDKWPHNSKRVNQRWARLLHKYGADIRKKVGPEDATPIQLLAMFDEIPDYPDIWKTFLK